MEHGLPRKPSNHAACGHAVEENSYGMVTAWSGFYGMVWIYHKNSVAVAAITQLGKLARCRGRRSRGGGGSVGG